MFNVVCPASTHVAVYVAVSHFLLTLASQIKKSPLQMLYIKIFYSLNININEFHVTCCVELKFDGLPSYSYK
jgi:hypothetical protein